MAPPDRPAGTDPTDPGPGSGTRLAGRWRPSSGPSEGTVVLVHGFTQTNACWSPVDDDLAADHDLVLVDAPGHGESGALHLDLEAGGHALVDRGGPATYLGYSMGGRLALHAALAHPQRVQRLVLVSATAGLDDPAERAARRADDERLAEHLVEVGVPAFVDEWLAQPLFAHLPEARAHRSARLANSTEGLASSLRLAGTGTQVPSWDRLGELEMPVLVVAGALDPKFVGLAERLAAGIGADATLAVVAEAGHTVHLEQPQAFLDVLRPWLRATAS